MEHGEREHLRRALSIHTKEKGGKLTTLGRRSLARGQFALAPGAEESRRGIGGRYPIPDAAHARNALARAAQHASPDEQARIRAAVHRKFSGIGARRQDGSP